MPRKDFLELVDFKAVKTGIKVRLLSGIKLPIRCLFGSILKLSISISILNLPGV